MTPFPRQPGTAVLPMWSTMTRGSRCSMACLRSWAISGARGSYSPKIATVSSYVPISSIYVRTFSTLVFRQQVLLDFSERVARKLLDQNELARDFEGRKFFAAAGFEIGGIERAGGDDIGDRNFATNTIGRSGDGGLGDTLLLFQKLFDLPGINVEAAGDDEIAFAAAQRVVAIGRADGEIARAE